MLDGVFARGTTPTHIFPLPGGLTTSNFLDFTISYRQKGKVVLIKRKADVDNISELDCIHNIILVLSQEDTLMFNPNNEIVEVQIKGLTPGNEVLILGEYRFRLENVFDEESFYLD